MKKVIVKNLQGVQTHGAYFEDEIKLQEWIDHCVKRDVWGKKEQYTIEIEDNTEEENDKKEAHKAKKKKIKDLIDKEVLDSDDIQKALKILLNNL